jgi:hypothetical protein
MRHGLWFIRSKRIGTRNHHPLQDEEHENEGGDEPVSHGLLAV